MIYKIVSGNTFKLHVMIYRQEVTKNSSALILCDYADATGIKASVTDMAGDAVAEVPVTVVSTSSNKELVVSLPATLPVGVYGISVEWNDGQASRHSQESQLFAIVAHNGQSNIPVGIMEGETTGMYRMQYYVINSSSEVLETMYFGASGTAEATEVPLAELTKVEGDLAGQSVTIVTTAAKQYAWIVASRECSFEQAGLPADLTHTEYDGLHYYRSDMLSAGDNVYYIK